MTVDMQAVVLCNCLMDYFYNEIEGACSDMAYYELLSYCHRFLNSDITRQQFVAYTEMVFNIDNEDLDIVLRDDYNQDIELLKEMELL